MIRFIQKNRIVFPFPPKASYMCVRPTGVGEDQISIITHFPVKENECAIVPNFYPTEDFRICDSGIVIKLLLFLHNAIQHVIAYEGIVDIGQNFTAGHQLFNDPMREGKASCVEEKVWGIKS